MQNIKESFLSAIGIHCFFIFGSLFLKMESLTLSEEPRKLIRLVSFASHNLKSNISKNIEELHVTSKIGSAKKIEKIISPISANLNANVKGSATGSGVATSLGSEVMNSSVVGIEAKDASVLELEINKLRVFLEQHLDEKISQKNINLKLEIIFDREHQSFEIKDLTGILSTKNLFVIKQLIIKYNKTELFNILRDPKVKILIPISII